MQGVVNWTATNLDPIKTMPIQFWEVEEAAYDGPEPCPMGCGNLTHDAAGGPCEYCWDDLYASNEPDDGLDDEEREALRAHRAANGSPSS